MTELVPIPSPGVPLSYGSPGEPLVLVLHDWYGRLPGLEHYAEALASTGFRVLVPDLFNGVATTDDAAAETLLASVDLRSTLASLDGLVADAREQGSSRVGLVGFSMGGWLALLLAQNGDTDAVVGYYASLSPAEHGIIPCAVHLHLAETDDWARDQEPEAFIGRLEGHCTPVSTSRYPGTRHGFANATVPGAFQADAAALAYARSARFLQQHLLE